VGDGFDGDTLNGFGINFFYNFFTTSLQLLYLAMTHPIFKNCNIDSDEQKIFILQFEKKIA